VTPAVSVLMTTRNGAAFIGAAIDSVLAQTLTEFELVVVDDGSTDATPRILADLAARDARLQVLRGTGPLGIVGARNLGFAACRAPLVAAHDHDDLSDPTRLAEQAAFLAANPEVVLVGTGVRLLHADSRLQPTDHAPGSGAPLAMRWALHVDNPLTWSSVMLRKAAVARLGTFLRAEYEYADDFDLHHRLLAVGEVARLDAVLTTYRWHGANTTHERAAQLSARAARVLEAAYRPLIGPELAAAAAPLAIRHLSDRQPVTEAATLRILGDAMEGLLDALISRHAGGKAVLQAAAARSWWRLLRARLRSGHPGALRAFRARPALRQGFQPGTTDLAASVAVGMLRAFGGQSRSA
jgi:glycosyltransferase involved in cell wall biosynthesis